MGYTVVSQGRVQGDTSNGIPHAFLFDASGKCVKEGHPDELTKLIEPLLASELHWITHGKKLASAPVVKITEALKAGRPFGWALDELAKLGKKNDAKVSADEVAYLKEQITAEAESMLDAAKAAEDSDAYGAWTAYDEIKTSFKKTEYEKRANDRVAELKKDKSFQEELKAGKFVAQIDELCGKLIAVEGKYPLDSAANRDNAANIAAAAKQLKTKFGSTKAARMCLDGLAAYGISMN